ncbi:MAG: helix-turn-helix transcriptional regulator [Deltaproteobacteria bacterium]|nr:MAG: helix-turn-helix transcriptional regulator [Deltaproteobacteria bacterium]TMQ19193.1 MAG: helix-turn-helix transcriptional regulator [Deltaproteobacteria bacterium]
MFQQRRAEAATVRITDPAAITVLASPVRQELFDTLEALGGVATIAELAEQLGRPADGLYYHVELLRRAGLLAVAPDGRSRAGRSERRYRLPVRSGRPIGLGYRPRDARNVAAVRSLVGGMLRIARRDFDRALAGDVVVDGPHRELWAARGTGWVSDAELAQINRLLSRLSQLLRRPRGAARHRLISLCFVLAPMTARPKRRRPAQRRSRPRTDAPRRRTRS